MKFCKRPWRFLRPRESNSWSIDFDVRAQDAAPLDDAWLAEIDRQHLWKKFPYSLVDRIQGDVIMVVAVAHARRRFGYWKTEQ